MRSILQSLQKQQIRHYIIQHQLRPIETSGIKKLFKHLLQTVCLNNRGCQRKTFKHPQITTY